MNDILEVRHLVKRFGDLFVFLLYVGKAGQYAEKIAFAVYLKTRFLTEDTVKDPVGDVHFQLHAAAAEVYRVDGGGYADIVELHKVGF